MIGSSVSQKISAFHHMNESLQAVVWFGCAVIAKVLGGLIVVKLSAILLGPSIFGRLGQMMSLVALISTFAGGGTGNALIHALSSNTDPLVCRRKWGAALKIYGCTSSVVGLLLILFSRPLSQWLLGDLGMSWVIVVLAFSQWLVGISNLLQAILGSLRKIRTIAAISLLGISLGVMVFSILLLKYNVVGATLGLVLMPAMLGIPSLWALIFVLPKEWRHPVWKTKWEDIRELFSYSLVTVVSTTALPTAHVFIRDLVSNQVGWQDVGYWQGVLKISDVYMQFVLMMGIYYALPRFSAQKDISKLNAEFWRILKVLLTTMIFGFMVLYSIRDFLIPLLFSKAFVPMRDYFLPYMVGDVFRIIGALCVYYAISRSVRGLLIFYELTMAISLFIISIYFLPHFGGIAPAYAHAIASMIACLFIASSCLYNKKRWTAKADRKDIFTDASSLLE